MRRRIGVCPPLGARTDVTDEADDRTGRADEGSRSRAECRRTAQHDPHPLQRPADWPATRAWPSRPPISTWRSSTPPTPRWTSPGQITAPGPHPLRDRPQAAGGFRGLAQLHGRRSASPGPRRALQGQPARPTRRRLPGDAARRAFRPDRGRHRRPDAADRPHPLRDLHGGDALLSHGHLPPHPGRRGAGRRCGPWPPTAIAWPWPICRRPKARPNRRASSCRARRCRRRGV